MEILFLVGRILFSFLFVMSGLSHFMQRQAMTGYAQSVGAPAPAVSVPATGTLIIIGGLSVGLGVLADLGALLLVPFLFSTAFIFHAFWEHEDPQTRQVELAHFMKDLALAGAALAIFYLYNQLQGQAELSLTDPLFGRG